MQDLARKIVDLANSSATVLITGESGTGKEVTAGAIHYSSSRREKPFLTVNCPSIPEDLFESEMFGHRRGSFTGAVESRGGYLKAAEGGTLFMDEIGDLPLRSQAKILRLLEQKTYLPVGEHEERVADVRIIAATNQSLETLVADKKFREDLLFRLKVCSIHQPPLRDRKDDIPILAPHFVLRFASEMGKDINGLDAKALDALQRYDYPGNVRELRNAMESSVIHCRHSGLLTPSDLPSIFGQAPAALPAPAPAKPQSWPLDTLRFEEVEKALYAEALTRADRNVSAAARILGLSRGRLRRRMSDLHMKV
jgi:DNA-binding NtrC family response regulator